MAASSASLCNFNKLSNLCFPTSHFPPSSKPKSSLKLKTQHHATSLHFSPSHITRFRCLSSSFETFNLSEDDQDFTAAETETEPETVSESEPETESKLAEASEEGRLYVGNLPYSMTSSQLSEVFEEAGRVISAEVFLFFSFLLCLGPVFGLMGLWGVFLIVLFLC